MNALVGGLAGPVDAAALGSFLFLAAAGAPPVGLAAGVEEAGGAGLVASGVGVGAADVAGLGAPPVGLATGVEEAGVAGVGVGAPDAADAPSSEPLFCCN